MANALTTTKEFKDAVDAAGIPLLDEYRPRPSLRDPMLEGRRVVTV